MSHDPRPSPSVSYYTICLVCYRLDTALTLLKALPTSTHKSLIETNLTEALTLLAEQDPTP